MKATNIRPPPSPIPRPSSEDFLDELELCAAELSGFAEVADVPKVPVAADVVVVVVVEPAAVVVKPAAVVDIPELVVDEVGAAPAADVLLVTAASVILKMPNVSTL